MVESWVAWLPVHWARPDALWGLLPALLCCVWPAWSGGRSALEGVIAPHLLPHLLVQGGRSGWLKPAHTLGLALACFSVALAGPAWEREAAPLAMDESALMLVLDLSESMDAVDTPPSRLDRARAKIQNLLARRGDAPTGLIVYAGSAHLVLPPTQDRQVLGTYLDTLSTALMPRSGTAPAEALVQALSWLDRGAAPGTVLFLTGDWPDRDRALAAGRLEGSRHRLIVWAVGDPAGGAIRDAAGRYRTEAGGRVKTARLEVERLTALRRDTGAAIVGITPDDADLARVQSLIRQHRTEALEQDPSRRWRDRGAWFVWPGLLALLCSFRRGWVLGWPSASGVYGWLLVCCLLAASSPSWAQTPSGTWSQALTRTVVGWWLTPDQQGRWWMERGEPARAAMHFQDPFWRGLAHARSGQWQRAADDFARLDSPAAWFNQAQMLARLGRFAEAVAAYDQALLRRPGWQEAMADRDTVMKLIPPPAKARPPEPDPDEAMAGGAGQAEGDRAGRRRTLPRPLTEAEVSQLWLQRLDTSPAGFLRRKFALQAQQAASQPGAER